MEDLWNKFGAIIAAIISSLGGLYLYDRQNTNSRLNKLEQDVAKHNTDVAVIRESLVNLKEDTQEIKSILQNK